MPYSDQGHLEYYRQFAISPVRYDLSDLAAHCDRRASLYRHLALPQLAFRGARVLEVAPGSGQNSLFVALCRPDSLDLVEPNPTGVADIRALYAAQPLPVVSPVLHEQTLQDFEPSASYDIVICENWLGHLPGDRAMIRKLASLVAPAGVLVMTIVPPVGFLPNVLRKLMADRLIAPEMSFEARTRLLVDAFGPHLATIPGMTRSHEDWVRDCMINPHYLNVALPLDAVLAEIGPSMEVLSSSPDFHTDWRWFKSLAGDQRQFNAAFEQSYLSELHNFIDYRHRFPAREVAENRRLDLICAQLHASAVAIERELAGGADWSGAATGEFFQLLEQATDLVAGLSRHFGDALGEAGDALAAQSLDARAVASQKFMAGLFGRETVYLSLTRAHETAATAQSTQ